jgi:Zn-dependent protease with chaperone function
MKKLIFKILVGFLLLSGLFFGLSRVSRLRNYLDSYGLSLVQEQFGSLPLNPEHEAFILGLIQELGIQEKIILYKTNSTGLCLLGPHNAFVIHPHLSQIFPISNQAIMYVSQGMFEDLTPAERRFLIGHELIHARDHHLVFSDFILLLALILSLVLCGFLANYMNNHNLWHENVRVVVILSLVLLSTVGTRVIYMGYRRYLENVADSESLKLLNSYEGFFAINERWQKKFGVPKHNRSCFGLFSDHPSCHEREQNCLNLQKQSQNQNNLVQN